MANVSEVDLAYAAGIVDGEGYIGITELKPNTTLRLNGTRSRKSMQHRVYVVVSMVDERVPMWLYRSFGGQIQTLEARKIQHKDQIRWSITSKQAARFCLLVLPYLKLKYLQAELLVEFYVEHLDRTYQGRNGVPDEEIKRRSKFVSEIKLLNMRGVH